MDHSLNDDEPAALQATYSDLKIIKTRGSFQLIFEMPLSDFNHAMAVLGGAPRPDQEVWVGIARLHEHLSRQASPPLIAGQATSLPAPPQPSPQAAPAPPQDALTLETAGAKARRTWGELPAVQRACMRCQDHRFWTWLHAIGRIAQPGEAETLDYVRRISGGSRGNLGQNGFEKETENWNTVDRAFAKHLDQQLVDSMR